MSIDLGYNKHNIRNMKRNHIRKRIRNKLKKFFHSPTYDDAYHYSPSYYPGYKIGDYQEKRSIIDYPFIKYDNGVDLQVFYNITDDDDSIPWGSTYKYTIPRSIDKDTEPSFNSISERQKRFKREFFTDSKMNLNVRSNDNMHFYLISVIVAIVILLFFATIYDMNKPYLCLYK